MNESTEIDVTDSTEKIRRRGREGSERNFKNIRPYGFYA